MIWFHRLPREAGPISKTGRRKLSWWRRKPDRRWPVHAVEVRASRVDYSGNPPCSLHVPTLPSGARRRRPCTAPKPVPLRLGKFRGRMRLTDETGVIVAVNVAYCKLVGVAAETLEGKLFTGLCRSTNRDAMLKRLRDISSARRAAETGGQYTLHDGRAWRGDFQLVHRSPGPALLMLSLFRTSPPKSGWRSNYASHRKWKPSASCRWRGARFQQHSHGHPRHARCWDGESRRNRRRSPIRSRRRRTRRRLTRQLLTFSRRQLIQPSARHE